MDAINKVTPHKHTYPVYSPHITLIAERGEAHKTIGLFKKWSNKGIRIKAEATHLAVLMAGDDSFRIRRFAL
jgi:hypothetical protein